MKTIYSLPIADTRDIKFSGRCRQSSKKNSNFVTLSQYNWRFILLNYLIQQFSRPVNVWLLVLSVVQLASSFPEPEFLFTTLLPFLVLLLFGIVKDLLYTYVRYKHDLKVNSSTTRVWDGLVFTEINTTDLNVGDFVVLYHSERVPADMILLCTGSAENKCFLDCSALLDDKDLVTKVPIESIRFQLGFDNLSEVAFKLKQIKGTATVPLPNGDFSNFEGKIKLKVAPVASNVKMKNFLLKDSKIMNTSWVIGLVVYTGNETKAWINSLNMPRKVSSIEVALNYICGFCICVDLVLSVVSFFISKYSSKNESFFNSWFTFVHFIVLYNVIVPAPLFIFIDLFKLVKVLKIQNDCPVTFRNASILEDLGKIEYILTDKTGTITEREVNVAMCIFKNVYFKNIEDLIDLDTSKTQSKLFEFTQIEKEHFVMCLAVCNKGFTSDYGNSYFTKSGDERLLISTATILGTKLIKRTSKSLTILKDSLETKYLVLGSQTLSKARQKCHIVLQTQDKSKTFLYMIGNIEAMEEVLDFTKNAEPNILEIITSNKQSGIRQLILAYKELAANEVEVFSNAYQMADRSPVNRQGRIESLFDELEEKSIYLGLIGLEEVVSYETRDTVTMLKKAGIKLWMLSGDNFESSLSAGFGSGIVDDSFPIIRIHDVKSEEEFLSVSEGALERFIAAEANFPNLVFRKSSLTIYQEPLVLNISEKSPPISNGQTPKRSVIHRGSMVRNHVTEEFGSRVSSRISQNELLSRGKVVHPLIRKLTNSKSNPSSFTQLKITSKVTKFTFFLDSQSFQFAVHNNECLKNLVFLLFCADSVCFTGLLPSDKTKITKILQNNFKFKPFFLAVGDGGSDVGMIKNAGIGVGIVNDSGSQASSVSDLIINEFSDLKPLILEKGLKIRANIKKVIVLGQYSLAFLLALEFLLNLVCDYSGPVFIPMAWYISYYLCFSVFGLCTVMLFDNIVDLKETDKIGLAYIQEALGHSVFPRVLGLSAVGALQAGVSVFVFYYGVGERSENISNEGVLLFIPMGVTINIVHIMYIQKYSFKSLSGPSLNIVFTVIMVVIQTYSSVYFDNYYVLTNFSRARVLVIHCILSILFHFALSLLFYVWKRFFLESPLESYFNSRLAKNISTRLHTFKQDIGMIFSMRKDYLKTTLEAEYSKFTLKFKSNKREKKHQEYLIPYQIKHYKIFSILLPSLLIILMSTRAYHDVQNISSIIILSAFSVVLIVCFVLLKPNSPVPKLKALLKFIYFFSNILMASLSITQSLSPSFSLIYPITFFLFLPEDWLQMVIFCTVNSFLLFRSSTLYLSKSLSGTSLYISVSQFLSLYLVSAIICGITTYLLKKQKLKQFNLLQKLKDEYDKVTSVLYYLLPGFVRKRVNNGVRYIAEEQGEVSVLFCYIVGFDKITSEYSIEELTSLLDETFGKIDSLCELVGVSKIETVANTYMACAGLKDSESELKPRLRAIPHARRAVELGFAILRTASKIYLNSGEKITLKIGIHSGKVTAGVVGYHKPQFSLVGDTVNTASRMASSAEKNTIRVSKYTYDLLGDFKNFDYTLNRIEVKGKGIMDTYTITLQQMINLDNFIEHRISVSPASLGSIGYQSLIEEESAVDDEKNDDFVGDIKIFQSTDFFEQDLEGKIEKVRYFDLGCDEGKELKEFRLKFYEDYYLIYLGGVVLKILNEGVMFITFIVSYTDGELYISVGLIIEILGLAVISVMMIKNYLRNYLCAVICSFYMAVTLLSVTGYIRFHHYSISSMYVLVHFQLIICVSGLFFSQIFTPTIIIALYWLVLQVFYTDYETLSELLPISVYIISLQFFTLFLWEKDIRLQHNISLVTHTELTKTESLLTQMIPKHVYDHLKDENSVTDHFFQVTIIYADIVGFTPWSSGKEAKEIVNMLSSLFTKFDKSSVKHNVYKVHTIGDCYVAMGYRGGVNRNPGQECVNMINFAYSMLKIIKKVQEENKELNMRIGLHTGDVIGGVMGTSIVRYDIYGTDVLIANQMESNGIPGKIVISESTKSFLEKERPRMFNYKFHTEVKALERTCCVYELEKVE